MLELAAERRDACVRWTGWMLYGTRSSSGQENGFTDPSPVTASCVNASWNVTGDSRRGKYRRKGKQFERGDESCGPSPSYRLCDAMRTVTPALHGVLNGTRLLTCKRGSCIVVVGSTRDSIEKRKYEELATVCLGDGEYEEYPAYSCV